MMRAQTDRVPVKRNPIERYKIEYMNLKSRLTLNDKVYRDLVAKHDSLEAALHADFVDAIYHSQTIRQTHREEEAENQSHRPRFQAYGNRGPPGKSCRR